MSINAQPFQPQFKLIGNLAEDQILQYDVSEGAFVNTVAAGGGGGASGYTAIQNMGATGTAIHFGDAGTTLQLKKLIGGDNLTITDNGTGGLILAATNTDTIQTGTNLGTGTALFSAKNAGTHALEFKSLAVGAGLTITDNGSGTVTLVNSIAAGVAGADLTLSNLSNVATARTNLDVYSKAEGNAKYHRTDANFLPATNNIYDVGSPTYKFNDIYAETFQGTAVLADQLTISATTGQVLTHNGSVWVAADSSGGGTLSSASDMSSVAPVNNQHLVWKQATGLWTPASAGEGGGGYQDSNARAAVSAAGDLTYNNATGVFTFTQNDTWGNITGTPTTLAGYGITDGSSYANSNVDAHLNTSTATASQVLSWSGTDYDWITSTDLNTTYTAGTGLTLTGTEFTLSAAHFDGAYASLTGKPTTVSSFTNDAGYLTSQTDSQTLSLSGSVLTISTGNNVDLGALTLDDFADVTVSGVADGQFLTYDNSAGDWTNSSISIFSGVFADLTSKPTTLAGYGITDGGGGAYANSNVDTHLNQSNPTSGYVLSWNGSDYAWVSNGSAGAHFTTADARTSISATTGLSYNNGTGVLSLNAELSNLSNVASTVPSTGQVLKWNGSTWTPGTDENDDTVYTSFNTDFDTRLSAKSTSNLAEGTNKYYTDTRVRSALSVTGDLSYNAATGVISYTASAHYDNADVDTHINKASATSGQILSWDGSDYDWIANSGTPAWSAITSKPTTIAGFGITDAFDKTFNSLTGKPTTLAGYGITDSLTADGSTTLTNKSGNISQWTNNTGYLTSVPAQSFSSLTGKPTTISGYGITDAFDGAYASLSGKPTIPTAVSQLTNDSAFLTSESDTLDSVIGRGAVTTTTAVIPFYYANQGAFPSASSYHGAMAHSHSDGAMYFAHGGNWNKLANSATTLSGYGITDGLTLAGIDSHLNQSNPTSGYVLSWNGSDYSWVANSGAGGSSDKITEGNSSVEVIDGGSDGRIIFATDGNDRWRISNSGHMLPELDSAYDLGSSTKKARHLYISNTLYFGTDTLATSSSNLLLNGNDVQDYANLKNKPDTISAGTGIQVNSGVVSINSTLSGLTDVHTATPTDGQVLKWDNGNSRWAPAADLTSGSAAMDDLTDVSTSGITSGQYLAWNGSSFVATTPGGGGASAIDDLSDVDTTTSAPSNGDVLTWVQADSEWAPAAPAGGGGGSGATIEYFKLNYATNGNLASITNTTSGCAATITSATGGTVDITFSSTAYPPAGIMVYGYAYSANKYVIKPVSGDMTTKEVTGGGSSGSPIAFGSMGSVKMTLKLREADTGSSRSFGTTTHAWLMFTTV